MAFYDFNVNLGDLKKMLEQIRIAEAHAAFSHGTGPEVQLVDLVTHALAPEGIRTVTGVYNNLLPGQQDAGAADQVMPRLLQPLYRPAEFQPEGFFGPGLPAGTTQTSYEQNAGNVFDSQPRTISNLIVDQTPNNPAAVITALIVAGSADPYGDAALIAAAQQSVADAPAAAAAAQAAEDAALATAAASAAAAVAAATVASNLQAIADADALAAADAQALADAANQAVLDALADLTALQTASDPAAIEAAQLAYDQAVAASDVADALVASTAASAAVSADLAATTAANSATLQAQANTNLGWLNFSQIIQNGAQANQSNAAAAATAAATAESDALAARDAIDPVADPTGWAAADAIYQQAVLASNTADASLANANTFLTRANASVASAQSGYNDSLAAATTAAAVASAAQSFANADALAASNAVDAAALAQQAEDDALATLDALIAASVDPALLAAAQAAYDLALADAAAADQAAVDAAATAQTSAAAAAAAAADAITAQALAQADADAAAAATAASDAADAAAAGDAQAALASLMSDLGVPVNEDGTIQIDNLSPDIGLSPSFNGWMTLFGQFFDHGLDLIGKGGSGTVYIPLQPDDPLYVEGGFTNFMVLTRATNQPGPDGVLGTADDIHEHTNSTTPFVDQNQTYTSHPSHQVFLREYHMVNGRPLSTGHLLDGATGGIANWAEVKAQAADLLGIELTDADIFNVPLLATDDYGEFIRGPVSGLPQVVMRTAGVDGIMGTADDGTMLVEGNLAVPISVVDAIRTGHAFLDDIAHNAVPVFDAGGNLVQDADGIAGNAIATNPFTGARLEYDNELLDQHFITGDGRGNENIGLTAVHHVFHAEHNRLVEANKLTILESGDLAFINEWLLTDVATIPVTPADIAALNWDGERLFQAARFATEMQYQHLVFEEFARKIQPAIDPFVFSHSADLDPAIFAEFANVVYRFGHSMLNETVARMNPDGTLNDIGLIEAFLNPVEFNASGIDADAAAGAIIRGMTRQTGNEIDEFVVEALRNNLVGLPLDLAAINLARGRDTGIPTFNDARAQFFELTGDSRLAPYASWVDFGSHINNPASIVNFIAAYGLHDSITSATTLDAKRAAATLLVFGAAGAPADRIDFLNSTGAWNAANSGLNNIDLWIGGLAEEKQEFGGMLGSTFNFVFESQLENLQNGDRFYYLSRTQGMNMLNELENNTFTKLVMRNTDLGGPNMPHLPGILFDTANHILEMNQSLQFTPDPQWDDPVLNAITPMTVRRDLDGDGDMDFLEYKGADHVVLGGSEEADTIIGGIGIDTLWGDGGNDRLDGGYEADKVFGGAGDDIITNLGGDDFLHGDEGNDVIHLGSGLVLGFGNTGNDFIMTGPDAQEVFGGEGNDFIIGNNGGDFLLGNEGDDWIEGGEGFDTLAGENSELFFNSPIIGHDVLNGQGNDTDYDGESGDDIMFQGAGVQRSNGMAGFDWAIHKGDPVGALSDLGIPIFVNQEQFILRDRFDLVEGLSGWIHNDILIGRNVVAGANAPNGAAALFDENDLLQSFSSALLQQGVDRIENFDQLVAHLNRVDWTWRGETHTVVVLDDTFVERDGAGNVTFVQDNPSDILLGGAGNDLFSGKAGNDIIDGDAWLNVKVRVNMPNPAESFEIDSLAEIQARMLTGEINPGWLEIVRRVEWADPASSNLDTAVYRDDFANYAITQNADGSYTVEHLVVAGGGGGGVNNLIIDGTDRLFNIERLLFADQEVLLNGNTITGTEGNDLLIGTLGNDTILGLGGGDIIDGQVGADILDGGAGNDTITGGAGNDTITGGADDDFLLGDDGDDTIDGGLGNDQMDGGAGNDTLVGGDGDDLMLGSAGNDTMDGGAGIDFLQGDDGDDTMTGGSGDDTLDVSLGNDVLVFGQGFGNDIVTGFDADPTGGQDRLDISAFGLNLLTFAAGVTITDAGADTLVTINGVDGGTILLVGVADPATVAVTDFVLV